MKLKYKYFIGTQVMFYEIEVVNEFIHSLYRASEGVENPENITVDMCFNISEFFEKVDEAQISKYDLIKRFRGYLKPLEDLGVDVRLEIYDEMSPKTMTDYRRDINHFACQTHDYVIWGESDCLFPVQIFEVLDGLMDYAESQNIYNYITTFAIRKMWDASWKDLEHVDFTDKPYHGIAEKDEPELAKTMPYSIRYVMSQEEMEEINSKVEQPDVRMITYPKFDGSCLVLSSDLLNGKYAEIICDNNHVSEEGIKIAHKCIPGLYAISDAISATGLDDGMYNFAGVTVEKKNNKVYLKNSNTLAGSSITMHETFKNLVDMNFSLEEAVRMTSYNASKYLKLENVGVLEKNNLSNFIVMDKNLNLLKIFLNGELVSE